jgi:hypothetical protein
MRKSIDIYDEHTINKLSLLQKDLKLSTAQLIRVSLDALIKEQAVQKIANTYITQIIEQKK